MKHRSKILLVLVILLTLHCAACINLPQDETTQITTTTTPPPSLFVPEDTAQQFLWNASGVVDTSKREYSYEEMVEDLAQLSKHHPSRLSYRAFGESVLGRSLYVAILGNPNAQKQVLVSAGIHGREYLTPLLCMKQIEYYLTYYDTGDYNGFRYASLFEEYCFYIVPMTNPDGIMLSQRGIESVSSAALRDQIRRTYQLDYEDNLTEQTEIDEYLKIWKANANGVDLNRNFPALWEKLDNGVERPSHRNYKGASAASEPETRAMMELTEGLSGLRAVLCIHSQGEVLYWDCGQTGALREETERFTEILAIRSGYRMINEQNNDASYSDWCALNQGLLAITIETGNTACPLPIEQFGQIWADNFDLYAITASYIKAHE